MNIYLNTVGRRWNRKIRYCEILVRTVIIASSCSGLEGMLSAWSLEPFVKCYSIYLVK